MSVTKPSKKSKSVGVQIHNAKTDKIEHERLMGVINPSGKQILARALPIHKRPKSKIIGAEQATNELFYFARCVVVKKGELCIKDNIEIGDEIYFGINPGIAAKPNSPSINEKTDDSYMLVSEDSVYYYIKSADCKDN